MLTQIRFGILRLHKLINIIETGRSVKHNEITDMNFNQSNVSILMAICQI